MHKSPRYIRRLHLHLVSANAVVAATDPGPVVDASHSNITNWPRNQEPTWACMVARLRAASLLRQFTNITGGARKDVIERNLLDFSVLPKSSLTLGPYRFENKFMFHCTIQSRHARIAFAIQNTDYWHCLFPVVSSISATQGLMSLDGLTTSTRPTLSITSTRV